MLLLYKNLRFYFHMAKGGLGSFQGVSSIATTQGCIFHIPHSSPHSIYFLQKNVWRIKRFLAESRMQLECTNNDEEADGHISKSGERGGSVVECRTPEREVRGSRPTAAVLCPWARHFTPRKYWLITQEAMAPSRHDWKIVDWDVKPQHNQHLKILWHGKANSVGDSEKRKKARKTEEDMGRQHQRMDSDGVWRFCEDCGRRKRWKDLVATSSRLGDWEMRELLFVSNLRGNSDVDKKKKKKKKTQMKFWICRLYFSCCIYFQLIGTCEWLKVNR